MAIFDFVNQQGSVDWTRRRAGIPTASAFDRVMTPKTMKPSESRKKYGMEIISERLLRWQPKSLDFIDAIAHGKEHEQAAVTNLEMVFGKETTPIGFVTTDDGRFGASPDRIAGFRDMPYVTDKHLKKGTTDTVIECKCPTIPIQMGYLLLDDTEAYKCQRQGQLWVAEADKCLFFSYNPRMPTCFIEEGRDEHFIAKLVDCLERFSDEIDAWQHKAISLGFYDAFPEILPPVDAAYAGYTTEAQMEKDINGTDYRWGG
jgi:hypothetical protein